MNSSDTEVPNRSLGDFTFLVCWYRGHVWVDDPFMGDGKECARCGRLDGLRQDFGTLVTSGYVLAYLFGLLTGLVLLGVVVL